MADAAESNCGSEHTEDCSAAPEYGNAVSAGRRSMTQDAYGNLPGLPGLEYNLMEHKLKLFVVSGLLIFEGSVLPLVLFYPLWYATDLRHGIRE